MKIKIICEHCGKEIELSPETQGNICYIHDKLNDNDFSVSDIDIEHELNGDLDDINDLDDIEVDTTLKEIRFNCTNCGNYIVLTEFDQF